MADKNLRWYQDRVDEMIEDDSDRNKLFDAVDDMFHGVIELPAQLKEFDDIRLNKDSTPHDALYNGTTFLANSRVRFEITPLGDAPAEIEKANRMEQSIGWHWDMTNMRGMSRKIFDIAHSALRYDLCVTRVDDLLHWLPKSESSWSKANRRAVRGGRFITTVLPPHSMHFQMSPLGGSHVIVSTQVLPLLDVVDYYLGLAGTNDDGKKIKAAVEKMKQYTDNSLEELNFFLVNYTDDEKRLVYGHITDMDVDRITASERESEENVFVFIDTENKMPFINYTVRGGASEVEIDPVYKYHPMLASAHWHGLWADSVLAKSLAFSDVIRRLRETREFYIGNATDQVPPDDGTGGAKPMPPGVDVKRMPPTQLDPQAFQVIADFSGSLNKTTGTSILGGLNNVSASTPYSSINAQIQLAQGNMNPQRNIIQDTIRDIAYMFCEWTKYTKKPLQSWRTMDAKVGDTVQPRGQEIQISDKDYDLRRTFISCTITPEVPTDQTQKINNARLLIDMGMSKRDALESLSIPHPETQLDASSLEKIQEGYVQALITELVATANAKVQMMVQQGQAQIQQQQMAQQQAQQQPPPPTPFDQAAGAGFDPSAGGQPPIQAAPGMGREQMNGQTQSGQDIAA